MNNSSRIVLGTAQLGSSYGIANKSGKPDQKTAFAILDQAREYGINTFDTAPGYGNSEIIIGKYIKHNDRMNWRPAIITKLPKNRTKLDQKQFIRDQINESRERLGVDTLDYYLIHDPEEVYNEDTLRTLLQYEEKGVIKNVGASVYTLEEAYRSIDYGLNVLQVPLNIFDRRFLHQHFLAHCRRKKVILMARSVFLQGLLFYEPELLPGALGEARDHLLKLRSICKSTGFTISELALNYVLSRSEIDFIVMGVDSLNQLEQNMSTVFNSYYDDNLGKIIDQEFSAIPQEVVDPRLWKLR